MFAFMNKESIDLTVKTGKTHFFSRSRYAPNAAVASTAAVTTPAFHRSMEVLT